jgi:hypothetical protein
VCVCVCVCVCARVVLCHLHMQFALCKVVYSYTCAYAQYLRNVDCA